MLRTASKLYGKRGAPDDHVAAKHRSGGNARNARLGRDVGQSDKIDKSQKDFGVRTALSIHGVCGELDTGPPPLPKVTVPPSGSREPAWSLQDSFPCDRSFAPGLWGIETNSEMQALEGETPQSQVCTR
ncbi:hypothetical protein HispidOSU_028756 [Sigmodon hispidus]